MGPCNLNCRGKLLRIGVLQIGSSRSGTVVTDYNDVYSAADNARGSSFLKAAPSLSAAFLLRNCFAHCCRWVLAIFFQQAIQYRLGTLNSWHHRHAVDDRSYPSVLANQPKKIQAASSIGMANACHPCTHTGRERAAHGAVDGTPL